MILGNLDTNEYFTVSPSLAVAVSAYVPFSDTTLSNDGVVVWFLGYTFKS